MPQKEQIYSQGASFSGIPFWLGLVLIILSGISLFNRPDIFLLILSILGIVLGTILLLSVRGIKIDLTKKLAHRFTNLLFAKITTESIDLTEITSVNLRLFSEAQTMNMKSITTTVRTRVYEIYLRSNQAKEVLLLETTNYPQAVELLEKLSEYLNIAGENQYEQRKKKAATRRNQMKRK